MDNAQVYLSLVRPTMIPIAGECAADLPFTGQIELHGWFWHIINLEEKRRAKKLAKPYERAGSRLDMQSKVDAKWRVIQQVEREPKTPERDKLLASMYSELESAETSLLEDRKKTAKERAAEDSLEDANQRAEDAEKGNYEFTFSKRVDLASTQMLNSMKAGDVFPTGVLTIHQSSANAGLSLVVTVQKVRLIDYRLKVEVTDTMTDMREEWTAEFASLAYVYKNRKSIDKSSDAGQAVAKAASQGTVRVFSMKNLGSPLG